MSSKDFVKFRLRERSRGRQAIFLAYYYKGKRHEESLRLYLIPEKTREDKKKNQETMEIAEKVRARRLTELNDNVFKLKTDTPNVNLLEMWQQKIDEANSPGNKGQWTSSYKRMVIYLKEKLNKKDIPLVDIDTRFCEGYKKFLLNDAVCDAYGDQRKLKSNSQHTYFAKFKALLHDACKHKYIDDDPAELIDHIKVNEVERSFLTFEELQRLVQTPCRLESVRVCFLFSCLTGLRRSDVLALKWKHVTEIGEHCRITFHQQKTKGLQYQDINDQAISLMGERGKPEDYVFPRLPDADRTNHNVRTWAAAAGITKYLTFHSGRHTFATLMLSLGTDLYTVSKLLGHSEIKTTQIYAKVLDKTRQDAVQKIPDLNL